MKNFHIILLLIIALLFVVSGCSRNIKLSADKYTPDIAVKNIEPYKDAQIYLDGFVNNAGSTDRYAYYSLDESVNYETSDLIPDYLWYCFEKAFKQAGMKVNEKDDAPAFYMVINDMNDTSIRFDINIYKGDNLELAGELTATIPAASGNKEDDPSQLERNSYALVDAAVTAVLNDSGFRTSVAGTVPGRPAPVEKKVNGEFIGIVKAVNPVSNEIIVSSGRIAYKVQIGDTVFIENDGGKINMDVSFPMQTIAKCKVKDKDRKNISKIKKGDKVYK